MGPLASIRVLDFGRYVAGPYCASLLADFGADVIRIEPPGGGEDRTIAPVTENGEGALFLQINRNKRSVALDPRAPGWTLALARLVASADVVIANVPDGALEKLGLNYEALCAIKADIILANLSSFGPSGPWAQRPGFDSVGQAMCGSAFLSGAGDTPYRTPVTWVDHTTALYAAFAVMVALRERAQSGRGQKISGSLLGSALAISSTFLIEQAVRGLDRAPIGNRSFLNGPTDTFRTQDGWIVTQVVGGGIFRRWANLMGEPRWLDDPRFATDQLRGLNGEHLSARMAQWCAARSSQQALDELAQANIPAGPVLSPQQALDHPQTRALGMFTEVDIPGAGQSVPLAKPPIQFSVTPAEIRSPPPRVGEHTHEVLSSLGLSDAEIASARAGV
ncbi:MAG: CoA transferase [Hyphomonadaceae bacterium]|nr:CoA transferase [Hyphomonadaceae bacterium]